MIKKFIILSIFSLLFISCANSAKNINSKYRTSTLSFFSNNHYNDLNNAIIELSNQLLLNIKSSNQRNNNFTVTTFVNLNNFTSTSSFGRVISETLINELHTRRFKVIDFRTQESLNVDNNGEFILTRDTTKLKDEIPQSLLIAGTYSKINEKEIVLNARIVDNFTSEVISTAKVIYTYENCKTMNICFDKKIKPYSNTMPIKEDK
jgi:TolB-like protein